MYFSRGFIVAFILSFLLLLGTMLFWANETASLNLTRQASQQENQVESERETDTVQSIFLNNFFISVPMVVPVLGVILFFATWHTTAYVVGLLAVASNVSATSYVLALFQVGFVEIFAYALLLSESLYVTVLLAFDFDGFKKRVIKQSWKTFLFYVLILFIAAVIEVATS
jgi:drug/metabolite transporter (DMT)-like permease